MASDENPGKQRAFATEVASLLRQSRRRQRLTQAQVSAATDGVVSKAALANYETGLRSLRIDVFWVLVKALEEDGAAILATAERRSGLGSEADTDPVTVDVSAVTESTDPRLEPVRRWFALRAQRNGAAVPAPTITLDVGAQAALARLMGVSVAECRAVVAASLQCKSDADAPADAWTLPSVPPAARVG